MPQPRFTKADVEYLIAAPKFIKEIPRWAFLTPALKTGWKYNMPQVFLKAAPNKPIKGLVVMAKAHQAPIGLPHPRPSSALEWFSLRIRGLNYEVRHDNPDGSYVRGWHEHLWSPQHEDALVIPARPEPTDKSLLGILKWGLAKWNIEVQREQHDLRD